MKLNIIGNAYAEAEVNLFGFKQDLPKDWDMEKAIRSNTNITKINNPNITEKDLKTLVWGAMDWAGIMDNLSGNHNELMKVKFYLVKFKDFKRLYPGKAKGNRDFEFIENTEDGIGNLLVQSFITNPNFDIKAFIKTNGFKYASTDKVKLGWGVEDE